MVWAFPTPGPTIVLAYRELQIVIDQVEHQLPHIGDPTKLMRPWLPTTCQTKAQRIDLWNWLEQVVLWINHEYVWDPTDMIPACWPQHPHLVHEIAVLADQRHHAGTDPTSESMERWHRDTLPAFAARAKMRLAGQCEDRHQKTWPAASRFARYSSLDSAAIRHRSYAGDVDESDAGEELPSQLVLLDLSTGEVRTRC